MWVRSSKRRRVHNVRSGWELLNVFICIISFNVYCNVTVSLFSSYSPHINICIVHTQFVCLGWSKGYHNYVQRTAYTNKIIGKYATSKFWRSHPLYFGRSLYLWSFYQGISLHIVLFFLCNIQFWNPFLGEVGGWASPPRPWRRGGGWACRWGRAGCGGRGWTWTFWGCQEAAEPGWDTELREHTWKFKTSVFLYVMYYIIYVGNISYVSTYRNIIVHIYM